MTVEVLRWQSAIPCRYAPTPRVGDRHTRGGPLNLSDNLLRFSNVSAQCGIFVINVKTHKKAITLVVLQFKFIVGVRTPPNVETWRGQKKL